MKFFLRTLLCAVLFSMLLAFGVCAETQPDIQAWRLTPVDEHNAVWLDENGNPAQEPSCKPMGGSRVLKAAVSLPKSYDSRTAGISFRSADQGSTDSCWAFSSITALEADLQRQAGAEVDLSEAHLVWFTHNSETSDKNSLIYGDGITRENPYGYGGYWFSSVFTLANGAGAALEGDFPFSDVTDSSGAYTQMGNYPESRRFDRAVRVDEVEYLGDLRDPNGSQLYADMSPWAIEAVKREIMEHGAVKASYYSDGTSYYTTPKGEYSYNQRAVTVNSSPSTNHAIAIMGWDDSFSRDHFKSGKRPMNDGAWLCKNSWGEGFGKNGFFWISYEEPSISMFTTFSAGSRDYDFTYQYDGAGYKQYLSAKTAAVSYGNVFTCQRDCSLEAVGFYTMQPNMNYTVKIYRGKTAGVPNGGELVATLQGSEAFPGYHSAELEGSLRLNSGEAFSAVVTISTTDGKTAASIPLEGTSDSVSKCSSKTGQSYISFGSNSSTWYDSTSIPIGGSKYNYNNVCIKAMVNYGCSHSYEIRVVSPTCTAKGYTLHTCSLCGDSFKDSETKATGHSYSPWRADYAGKHDRHCLKCNSTETEACFDAEPEFYAGTCVSNEYREYTCDSCGYPWRVEIPGTVTAHSYSVTDKKEPTCTEEGYKIYTCSGCADTYKRTVKMTAHQDSDGDELCDRCEKDLSRSPILDWFVSFFRLLLARLKAVFGM